MPQNLTHKLITAHLVDAPDGSGGQSDRAGAATPAPGTEIGLRIDQTLTQDATGTLVMLELESMGVDRVQTELSVQYVDHNLLQTDFRNPDDHLFLQTACARRGVWFSRAGNGVSHPVHQERFGKPGKTLAGSDSHTPAAGAMGMFAVGAGGLDVAFAMAGKPLYLKMPKVRGVRLTGKLPDWVSAKDVVLEMLRRYDVKGCRGYVLEYFGPGLAGLASMDRHVIANMGTELGATTTVFPADEEVERFLAAQQRGQEFESGWVPDEGCSYDDEIEIDLSSLEPLIATPSSPGNVVPVREVAGKPVNQCVIGSSANPGLRDFAVPARMLEGRSVHPNVSFDVNPTSRQVILNLNRQSDLGKLVGAGARFHQAGCLGCIGMGQAPASGQISLRTMPRNFPGRSGTLDDQVYLCSPETATASALTGKITDPRDLTDQFQIKHPHFSYPYDEIIFVGLLQEPLPPEEARETEVYKGPNIVELPDFSQLQDAGRAPALLKLQDNVSTDEILRAGAEVLPLRSNIPAISEWAFYVIDQDFYKRAQAAQEKFGGHFIVAGDNYAQGSSREHAAIAPRYLGQIAVLAKSYARIGWQNLVNFGILPLEFEDPADYDSIDQEDELSFAKLRSNLENGEAIVLRNESKDRDILCTHSMSERQREALLAGGVINYFKLREAAADA